ncbi:MAG TPA: cytochrome P450 [Thermoleophilaceae bacterium]|nr:cytochrome P450 [Thermoleophilaceae bacterium]
MGEFPLGAVATLEELESDPHPLLAQLREREPVSWLPALGGWLVTRRDLALRAMRDPDALTVDDPRFSTGQVLGRSMLTSDGAEHERHRRPFARPLRRDAVRERFSDFVRAQAELLIEDVAPRGRADLRATVAGPLAATVMAELLGLQAVGNERLLGWYAAIVDATSGLSAGRPVPEEGRHAAFELRASTDHVLSGEAAGGLSPEEVSSNAAVLLFGGIETTEGAITGAVLNLLSHEEQLALVRAEPGLLTNAIEECMRIEPPAASIDRYATRDLELGGAQIRRGDLVTISLAAANRDPAVFPDPDRFDVRRTNAVRHVAFAHGPHVCIGMHLARLEARIAIELLLARLPGLRLDPARHARARGLVFRKPAALDVRWDQ